MFVDFPCAADSDDSTQDMYIFFAGAIFTFFCFWLIWHYLG